MKIDLFNKKMKVECGSSLSSWYNKNRKKLVEQTLKRHKNYKRLAKVCGFTTAKKVKRRRVLGRTFLTYHFLVEQTEFVEENL